MTKSEHLAFIREFLDALSGKPKSEAVVHHYIAESDEALRRHILHYEAAFPHFELAAQDQFPAGSCVLVHVRIRGIHEGVLWSLPPAGMKHAPPLRPTQTGEFMGLPPTGREIVLPIAALYRFSGNKIVEHRLRYDASDLLRQLGVLGRSTPRSASESECRGQRMRLWQEIQ